MVRLQIQLTEEQHRLLKRWAQARGISFSEAVRRCVTDRLATESATDSQRDRVREAEAVIGKYADATGDSTVGRNHDDFLADAYGP